jgi:hypothetical protein
MHYNCLVVFIVRSNLVKIITLIIDFPPFYSKFCSTDLSSAKVANEQNCRNIKT